MKKIIHASLLLVILASFFSVPVSRAESIAQCRTFFANDGYFFDNYESHDYSSGFLAIHFRLKSDYADGRGWNGNLYLHKPDCSTDSVVTLGLSRENGLPPHVLNFSLRFPGDNKVELWNDEVDLPIVCDTCSYLIENASRYTSISFFAGIDGNASFLHTGSFPITENFVPKNPVILIPGLLGTQLNTSNGDILWPNIEKTIQEQADRFMDPLGLNADGSGPVIAVGPVLQDINYPLGSFDYVKKLQERFILGGYAVNSDLYLFNYDWRLGIKENSVKLAQKISDVLRNTGAFKVNVVAHSYGGLITKKYIFDTGAEQKIDKAVFVGVPNLGAPQAAKTLMFGDNFNFPLLNQDEIRSLAQNMPSIYQVLPSKEYFKHQTGFYDDITNIANPGILDYDRSKAMLVSLSKNSRLLDEAEALHDALDNFDYKTLGVDLYNIVGCGTFTVKTITKMFSGAPSLLKRFLNQPKYRIFGDGGDGTVPLASAKFLNTDNLKTLFVLDAKHSGMLSYDKIPTYIFALTRGTNIVNLAPGYSFQPDFCGLQGKLVNLPSDLEISVKDPATQRDLNSGFDYTETQVGNDSYVFLPTRNNQQYALSAKPKTIASARPVSVAVKNYVTNSGNTTETTNNYENITIKQNLVLNIKDDNGVLQNYDADNNAEEIVPTYQQNNTVEDINAPQSNLLRMSNNQTVTGGDIVLSLNDKKFRFKVSDNSSGVFQSAYSLDSGETWKTVLNETLIDIPIDTQQILFYSSDKAGNIEDLHVLNFTWDYPVQNQPAPATPPENSPQPSVYYITNSYPQNIETPEVESQIEDLEDLELEEPAPEDIEEDSTVSFSYELPEMVMSPLEIHITLELPESLFIREAAVDNQEDAVPEIETKEEKEGLWSKIKGLGKKLFSFFENLVFL